MSSGSATPLRDGQHDFGVRLAAHALDRLVQRQVLHFGAVDAGDQVARQDAGMFGRRALDRRDIADIAFVALADLDAEADEFAFGAFAQFAVGGAVEIGRVRVERGDHAADRLGHQLALLDRFDVVGLDQAIRIGQLAQAGNRHAVGDRLVGQRRELHRGGDADDHPEGDQAGILEGGTHKRSKTIGRTGRRAPRTSITLAAPLRRSALRQPHGAVPGSRPRR
jgi:hypothetical protein